MVIISFRQKQQVTSPGVFISIRNNSLTSAASEILPNKTEKKTKQIWRDDEDLNKLLEERSKTDNETISYKKLTRLIKSRIRKLRNEKMRKEAEELNEFATKREIEALYKTFKSESSAFRDPKQNNACDPQKMKEYFAKHFGPR